MKKLTTLITAFALLLGNMVSAQTLRAYYPFNGSANDQSGNGLHGTVGGAVLSTDRFGNPNSAYQFDGVDDYIYLGQNVFSDSLGTITFWFNAVDLFASRPIFSQCDSSVFNSGMKLILTDTGAAPGKRFQYTNDQRDCDGNPTGLGTRPTYDSITPGIWYFGAVIVDQDSTRYYLNCSEAPSYVATNAQNINGNWFADLCNGDHATFIGKFKRSIGESYFFGKLDDIRIFDAPLDSTQLDSLCTEGVIGITEQTQTNTITIYPNPTAGKFTVGGATGKVEVYDLFGRFVLCSTELEIDMRGFASGMYYVKVGEVVRKLVIE